MDGWWLQVQIVLSRGPKWGYGVDESPSPSTTVRLPANAAGYAPSTDASSSSSSTKGAATAVPLGRQSVEWLCPVCTLHNPLDYDDCGACGTIQPVR